MRSARAARRWAGSIALLSCGLMMACAMDDGVLGGLLRDTEGGDDDVVVVPSDSGLPIEAPDRPRIVEVADTSTSSPPPADSGVATGCRLGPPRVGAVFENGTRAYETCPAALAAATFLNALCTCHDVQATDYLQTSAFDSQAQSEGGAALDTGGAAVGVNGNYQQIPARTEIRGSLSIAGSAMVWVLGVLDISGDWRVAADVVGAGRLSVGRNAWLGGAFVGTSLEVKGDLHHQGALPGLGVTAARSIQEPVSVPAPCACAPENLLAINSMVDVAAAEIGRTAGTLDPDRLNSIARDEMVRLDCGRYYLTRVTGAGKVVLDIQGQVVVFVGESIDLQGDLEVRLAPGAEIDLFVRGDMHVSGQSKLGDRTRPAATRIYTGGSADIALGPDFVGNLYAPHARATTSNATTVWGSLFVSGFLGAGSTSFVYDTATVLHVPATCNAPSEVSGCLKCGWCQGGSACVDGVCAPCRTDDDCCSQFVCSEGTCMPLGIH